MFGLSDFHTGDDKILMQKTLRIKLNRAIVRCISDTVESYLFKYK